MTNDELFYLSSYKKISFWLMSCFAYYKLQKPFLLDEQFDFLSHLVKECLAETEHPHKHLIDKEFLTTGYYIKEYPLRIQQAAINYLHRPD